MEVAGQHTVVAMVRVAGSRASLNFDGCPCWNSVMTCRTTVFQDRPTPLVTFLSTDFLSMGPYLLARTWVRRVRYFLRMSGSSECLALSCRSWLRRRMYTIPGGGERAWEGVWQSSEPPLRETSLHTDSLCWCGSGRWAL